MRIQKKFQGTVPENKILDTYSKSQTDTYSCNMINTLIGSGTGGGGGGTVVPTDFEVEWVDAEITEHFKLYNDSSYCRYAKIGNMVNVQFVLSPASANNVLNSATETTAFKLPEEYRPSQNLNVLCQGSGTNIFNVGVNVSGNVNIYRYRNSSSYSSSPPSTTAWLPCNIVYFVDKGELIVGSGGGEDYSDVINAILDRIKGYGGQCEQVTGDWNTACGNRTGFFMGYGLENAPTGWTTSDWWYVIQLVHNAQYKIQLAFSFSPENIIHIRYQSGGGWSGWSDITTGGSGGSGGAADLTEVLARISGYGESCTLVTGDWNTACGNRSGFFMGQHLTNPPAPSVITKDGWWYVIQLVYSENYKFQLAFSFQPGIMSFYHRAMDRDGWGDWEDWYTNTVDYVKSEIYYKPGDTYANAGYHVIGGAISSSTKGVFFTITLPKRLNYIQSVTCKSCIVSLRGIKGYLNSRSGQNEYVGDAEYSITCEISSENTVYVSLVKTSAFTNTTNNTPVSITGNFVLEFN